MRKAWLALGCCLALALGASAQARAVPVIVDEDGAVDDMAALALLLASPRADVRAVTVTPADSYLGPATEITRRLVDRLGGHGVTIAQGHSEGANPFPAEWREDHGRMLGIPALKGPPPANPNRLVAEDAPHHLVRMLSGRTRYVIVATGPLSNIADALRLDPRIRRNIVRIYVMGGAVRVHGNVDQPGRDGSAEWNFYNQPKAAAAVLASGLPITLVALDATNKAPMTLAFAERLAERPAAPAQIVAQMMRPALKDYPGEYYFWDTLTAAVLLDPSLVRTQTLKLKVLTSGPSQGRTVEAPDGAPVQVALDADHDRIEALFLKVLGR